MMTGILETVPMSNGESQANGPIDWERELRGNAGWLRSVLAARLAADEIDEVMQDVALAAVASKSPPQEADKIGPWLYRIAVRQSLLFRRRMGRQRKLMDQAARQLEVGKQANDGPVAWLLADERQRLVRQAVKQLARRDREILMLKYDQGWSYQQMSCHLGVSVSAVEARLHRARQRLREELQRTTIE